MVSLSSRNTVSKSNVVSFDRDSSILVEKNVYVTKKVIRETRHFLAQNVNFIEKLRCSMFAKIFQVLSS